MIRIWRILDLMVTVGSDCIQKLRRLRLFWLVIDDQNLRCIKYWIDPKRSCNKVKFNASTGVLCSLKSLSTPSELLMSVQGYEAVIEHGIEFKPTSVVNNTFWALVSRAKHLFLEIDTLSMYILRPSSSRHWCPKWRNNRFMISHYSF